MDYSLDFKTFAIAQPNASTTQCDSDYFQVGGVVNDVPLICGDNDNQHSESSDTNTRPNRRHTRNNNRHINQFLIFILLFLVYLEAPSFNSELWLLFKFGVSTLEPKWNIKISLIPCDSAVIGTINSSYF